MKFPVALLVIFHDLVCILFRMDSPNDPRFQQPDQRGAPDSAVRGVTEPPPWARGPRGPMVRQQGPPSPRSPTTPQAMRPTGYGTHGSLGGGPPGTPRPLGQGDLMRGAASIQPYRPPQPHPNDTMSPRNPQPIDPYRGGAPRQPIRPQNSLGPQGYPGPNRAGPPIRGQRPPVSQQMIQNQMNHVNNNPWNKDADARRWVPPATVYNIIYNYTLTSVWCSHIG